MIKNTCVFFVPDFYSFESLLEGTGHHWPVLTTPLKLYSITSFTFESKYMKWYYRDTKSAYKNIKNNISAV